jgi:hypothetical protein
MNTEPLRSTLADHLADNADERVAFLESLVGVDTRNPPGSTADAVV